MAYVIIIAGGVALTGLALLVGRFIHNADLADGAPGSLTGCDDPRLADLANFPFHFSGIIHG